MDIEEIKYRIEPQSPEAETLRGMKCKLKFPYWEFYFEEMKSIFIPTDPEDASPFPQCLGYHSKYYHWSNLVANLRQILKSFSSNFII
ncbi:MAG: hypothetical protein IPI46_01665 [Bacteroidetes bacterium]|nr:hypothetical protein [Bacteroidota bacterium]